ncbi:hypothetical protein GIB67_024962, partial [Kingdonia uniflora]
RQAVRMFASAPIVKRYDTFTLETADGFTIIVKGFINFGRTSENGISSEICNHFLLGFPYYWETYANQSLGEKSTCKTTPANISDSDKLMSRLGDRESRDLPVNLDELPVTSVRDLLLFRRGELDVSVLKRHKRTDLQEGGPCTLQTPIAPKEKTPTKNEKVENDLQRKLFHENSPVENLESVANNAQEASIMRENQKETLTKDEVKKSGAQLPLKEYYTRRSLEMSKKSKRSVKDNEELLGDSISFMATLPLEGAVEQVSISPHCSRDLPISSPMLSALKKNKKSGVKAGVITSNTSTRRSSARLKNKLKESQDKSYKE